MEAANMKTAARSSLCDRPLSRLMPGLILLFGLQGCAGLAFREYRPYSRSMETGYSEVRVAKDVYEIFYAGRPDCTPIQAKKLAILRAAEVIHGAGGRWFRIESEEKSMKRIRRISREGSPSPDSGRATVIQEDVQAPEVTLRIRAEGSEGSESLDAEAILREGREKGWLRDRD